MFGQPRSNAEELALPTGTYQKAQESEAFFGREWDPNLRGGDNKTSAFGNQAYRSMHEDIEQPNRKLFKLSIPTTEDTAHSMALQSHVELVVLQTSHSLLVK